MSRLRRNALFLLATLLAVLAGGAYWTGAVVADVADHPPPNVRVQAYERRWFTSTLRTQVDALIPLAFDHTVYHGPLPLHGTPRPALALVETSLGDGLLARPEGKEPLLIRSRIALDQSSEHSLWLNALRLQRLNDHVEFLELAEVQGEMTVDAQGRPERLELAVPNVYLMGKANGLALTLGETVLGGDREGQTYRLTLDVTIVDWVMGGEQLGPGRLRIEVDGLDAEALPALAGTGQAAELLARVQTLLAAKPQVKLSTFYIDSPRGTLSLQGELTLRAVNPLTLLSPKAWPNVWLGAAVERGAATLNIAPALLAWVLPERLLAAWREQGYVERQGDRYRAELRLEDGRLLINDIPVPLS